MTGSALEKREIEYATNNIRKVNINESSASELFSNVTTRFGKKLNAFKLKGIRSIKNDIYELNLRLRVAETSEDLFFVIRQCNTDIAILEDYLTEDISETEKQTVYDTIKELYDIRTKAAKNKEVRSYSNFIQVVYPTRDKQ